MALCNSCNSRFNTMGCYSPYYCSIGPAGPAGPPGPPGPPGPCGTLSSILVWASGTVSNTAPGSGLCFTDFNATEPQDYTFNGSSVTILSAGCYLIEWKLFVPRAAAISTVVSAQLNLSPLPSGRITVDHPSGSPSAVYSGQALAHVTQRASLALVSTNMISIAASGTDSAASMSVVKLS